MFGRKHSVLISGMVLLMGFVIFYVAYTSTLALLREQIKERLEDRALTNIDKIDRIFYERYLDLRALAADGVMSSGASAPESITRRLKEWQNEHACYASVSFFNANRIKIAGTSPAGLGEQHPFTHYMKGVAEGKDFVMGISESRSLKEVAFYFASFVKDRKGSRLGVVVARLTFGTFYGMMRTAGINAGEEIAMDLVNKDGLILYSSYNSKGVLKETLPEWEHVRKQMAGTKKTGRGALYFPVAGNEMHSFAREKGYLDFVGNDWILILHFPERETLGPTVELRIIFLTIGGVVLVIMALFHVLLQKK